ncbi:MAG: hypothetical protein Q9213_002710 [Squamulea squamosa]
MPSLLNRVSNAIWRVKGTGRVRLLAPAHPLKEEPLDFYCPGRYHPVKLGDVFRNRYKVIRKLGWGLYSTVWLAKDASIDKHIALKILSADAHGYYNHEKKWQVEQHTLEREVLQDIGDKVSDHPGRQHLPTLLDHFEHTGPHGTHVCLVLPVLGRSLEEFASQWSPPTVPSPIMRQVTAQLLSALDFLHRTCGIIHTDIKPSNILFDLNSSSTELQAEDYIKLYFDHVPTPIGISYPDFDYVQSQSIYAPITDPGMVNIQLGDLGSACWKERRLTDFVQPIYLRAPEVIFQLPWSTAADVWMAGVIILEIMTARALVRGKTINDRLAQMAALLGPFPQNFVDQVPNKDQTFTPDGLIVEHEKTYEKSSLDECFGAMRSRPDYKSPVTEEERRDFLSFLRSMLRILPEERKTAQELLDLPWLHKHYDYPEYVCE